MINEATIVTGLNDRDSSVQAFDALYDRLFQHVLLFTEKITRDEKEAEDITVDAFARLWEKLHQNEVRFERFSQVRSFLYTSAKNSAISYLRSLKAKKNYTHFLVHTNAAEETAVVQRYGLEAAFWEKLFDEINNLPEKCQEVFKLRFLSGLSRTEVAEQLNLSKKTVDRHCETAIDKLKLIFSEKELLLFLMLLTGFCKN